jgi:hypothetical protein
MQKQPLNLKGLPEYYQTEFKKIYDSNENYKGKWNWWAFLFTGLWFLYKGCWGYLLIFCIFLFTTSKINMNENILMFLLFAVWILIGPWNMDIL